jgi:hypothetical protein
LTLILRDLLHAAKAMPGLRIGAAQLMETSISSLRPKLYNTKRTSPNSSAMLARRAGIDL